MVVLAVVHIDAVIACSPDSPALFSWKGMYIMNVHHLGAGELGKLQC